MTMKKAFTFLLAVLGIGIITHAKTPTQSFISELDTTLTQNQGSFPTDIAIDGNTLVVSAGWENTNVANKAGAIYIYELVGENWDFKQRITSPQGQYDGIFGNSIAISGNYIVVGEPNAQKAHVYTKNNSLWQLDTTFNVTDVSSERYGISCAIEDSTLVVGSGGIFAIYGRDAVGSAYVYHLIAGKWEFDTRLIPSNGQAHDNFANSVTISNNIIACGAPKSVGYVGTEGYVCIFEEENNVWSEKYKLYAPDGYDGNRFGTKTVLSENSLVINATGALYYYAAEPDWTFKQKITSPEPIMNDGFGGNIDLSGDYLFASAAADDQIQENSGALYIYEKANMEFQLISKIKSENPTANERYCNGAIDTDLNYLVVRDNISSNNIAIYKLNWIEPSELVVESDTINLSEEIVLPVSISNISSGDNIISYQFDIDFDNTVLEYTGTDLIGTIAEGGTVEVNTSVAGRLSISYMNSTALAGSGELIKLQFNSLLADTTEVLISNAYLNSSHVTDLTNGTVIIRDVTPPTAAITYDDTENRCGDDLLITATFNEPMLEENAVRISLTGGATVTAANMTRVSETVYIYLFTIPNATGNVTVSLSNGTDLWGNEVVATPTSGTIFSIVPITYGDVDDDGTIFAYDAALTLQYSIGLDPLPAIDPLPWESWRDTTANVDGIGSVSTNDAGLILQYSAAVITSFDSGTKKSAIAADVSVEVVDGEIVFYSSGDLIGLNVSAVNENNLLGEPVIVAKNFLSAKNISGTTYKIGLCTSVPATEGDELIKIPFNDNGQVTFDLMVNTIEKSVTVDLATGMVGFDIESISIYPNPTREMLYVEGLQKQTICKVYNANGQMILSKIIEPHNSEISVSMLPTGLYLLRLSTDEGVVVKRFMKK